MQNGEKLPKRKTPVDVGFADGSSMKVMLFVSPQGRVLDMLNDGRVFLPLETEDGEIIFVRKEAIRSVTPVSAPNETNGRADGNGSGLSVSDPYELLGISREASAEAIREAYRQRCRENHPDRLQALGLPRHFIDLATRRMAEINAAYDRLKEAQPTN
jgi:DnaJ-domain-containing protein 1